MIKSFIFLFTIVHDIMLFICKPSSEKRFRWTLANQRSYMDDLAKALQITDMSGWYAITRSEFAKHGGQGLLTRYNGSPSKLLRTVYPEYKWQDGLFHYKPTRYWDDVLNQRSFLDDLVKKSNISPQDALYKISRLDIAKKGGWGLLAKYNGSRIKLIQSVYPEYKFDISKFGVVPRNYWKDMTNQRNFMDQVAKTLHIKSLDDWNRVSVAQFCKMKGLGLLQRYSGSLVKALRAIYPENSWKSYQFYSQKDERLKSHSKTQILLFNCIINIFPGVPISYNHTYSSFKNKINVEFDVFIPSLSMAFEYNGEYHYKFVPIYGSKNISQRDEKKRRICEQDGISLFVIPYWWNRTTESVAATISSRRPDIKIPSQFDHGEVIPAKKIK